MHHQEVPLFFWRCPLHFCWVPIAPRVLGYGYGYWLLMVVFIWTVRRIWVEKNPCRAPSAQRPMLWAWVCRHHLLPTHLEAAHLLPLQLHSTRSTHQCLGSLCLHHSSWVRWKDHSGHLNHVEHDCFSHDNHGWPTPNRRYPNNKCVLCLHHDVDLSCNISWGLLPQTSPQWPERSSRLTKAQVIQFFSLVNY